MVSFETAVLALAILSGGQGQGETVLLDFCADWCVPCRQMDPAVKELEARGYPVRKVNVDQNPGLAARYGVDRLPSFVMVVEGKVVDRVVGGTTFSRLERMCELGQARRGPEPAVQRAGSERQGAVSPPVAPSRGPALGPASANAGPEAKAGPPADSRATTPAAPASWRLAGPSSATGADPTRPCVDHLIAATVRLRIEDPDGQSCGSGTIIDARDGEALILTCGHIFRDSQGRGRIEVDLFGPAPAEGVSGNLLAYDLKRDIGLLTIRAPGPVATASMAPPGYQAAKDDSVITLGCNNGEPPSACYSRVTSVDKYLPPANVEVAGLPVQGRSGGGLFSHEGLLMGVCFAADPADNEGLYTALAEVQAALDEADLSFVYLDGCPARETPLVALDPPPVPKRMPGPSASRRQAEAPAGSPTNVAQGGPASDTRRAHGGPPSRSLSEEESAALEEIQERRAQGAEVICVIRSRSDPQAPSEIIVLDRVSPAFLEQLAAQSRAERQQARHLTSLEIRNTEDGPKRRPAPEEPGPASSRTLFEYRAGPQ
jgi:thiol-disulfide isomerase/thioredoxin